MPDSLHTDDNSTCYVLVTDNDIPVDNAHVEVQTSFGITLVGDTNTEGWVEFDLYVPFIEGQVLFNAIVTKDADNGGAVKESVIISDKPFAHLSLSIQDGVIPASSSTLITAKVTDRDGNPMQGVTVDLDDAILFGTTDVTSPITDASGDAFFNYTAPSSNLIQNQHKFDIFKATISVPNTLIPEVQEASLIIGVSNPNYDWLQVDVIGVSEYVITGNVAGTLALNTDVQVRVLDQDGTPIMGQGVTIQLDASVATANAEVLYTDAQGMANFTLTAVDWNVSKNTIVTFNTTGAYSTTDQFLLLNHNETDAGTYYAADIDFTVMADHNSQITATATVWDQTGAPAVGVPCQFFIPPTAQGIPAIFQGGDEWGFYEYSSDFDMGDYASYLGSWYRDNATVTDGSGQLVATIDTSSFVADSLIPLQFGVGGYGVAEGFNTSANNWWWECPYTWGYPPSYPPMTDGADGEYYWQKADFTLTDLGILKRANIAVLASVETDSPYISPEDPSVNISMTYQNESGVLIGSNVELYEGTASPSSLDNNITDILGKHNYTYDAVASGYDLFDAGIGFTSMVNDPEYAQFPFNFYTPYLCIDPDLPFMIAEPDRKLINPSEYVDFTIKLTDIYGDPLTGILVNTDSGSNITDANGETVISKNITGSGIVNTTFSAFYGGNNVSMVAGVIVRSTFVNAVHNLDKDIWYPTIQQAIDDADPGNHIWARSGTYHENIVINKSMTLTGEDMDTTIIDGGGIGSVVYVSADWVTITGFTVTGSGSDIWEDAGIDLVNAQNCYIANNIVSSNNGHGINLDSSHYNTISDNIANSNNNTGIYLGDSNDNVIEDNIISSNNGDGIKLRISYDNTISDNIVSNNNRGIYLESSNGNTIDNNTISLNINEGIFIYWYSNNNIIANNNASSNGFGIRLYSSIGNLVCHNDIINNTVQAYDDSGTNFWDNSYPSGGNYWSDYGGVDNSSGFGQNESGSDGIGDTPYTNIEGGAGVQDNYPLMVPGEIMDVTPPEHWNEQPGIGETIGDPLPLISVHVTDDSGIDASTIRLYVDGFMVFYDLIPIANGYSVSFMHIVPYVDVVIVRIVADDMHGNHLDFSWEFVIDCSPPDASNMYPVPGSFIPQLDPTISVDVTDLSGVDLSSIRLYINNFAVWYTASAITDGYHIEYWHESGFSEGEVVTCRIVADDISGNSLDFTWQFTAGVPPPLSFDIPLSTGWNFISFPLVQSNTSILTVLSSIDGQWDRALYYDATDASNHWKSYNVNYAGTQTLYDIDHTMGFWLHMTNDTTLTVNGILPENVNVQLYAGWNMVGYPVQDDNNYTVADLKADTGADIIEGFNSSALYDISQLPDSYVLKKGEAYWVHLTSDAVWMLTSDMPDPEELMSITEEDVSLSEDHGQYLDAEENIEPSLNVQKEWGGRVAFNIFLTFALILGICMFIRRRSRKYLS